MSSYFTDEDATQYFETAERSMTRRMKELVFHTTDPKVYQDALLLIFSGEPGWVATYYGHVMSVKPEVSCRSLGMPPAFTITIRPALPPSAKSFSYDKVTFLNGNEAILPLGSKEQHMKVYEALVVKIDEKGEVVEILKVVPPFVAKSASDASLTVRVDYAQENHLNGKDASALQVRVREFCGS